MFEVREFGIVRCEKCSLVYTSPRLTPGALLSQYDGEYFKSEDSLVRGYEHYVGEKTNIQKTFARRWARIAAMASCERGNVLDLGCAHGFLLDLAQNAGWQARGLDTSRVAVEYARNELGIEADQVDLNELVVSQAWIGKFDVVILWDVLEHVIRPLTLLRSCFDMLKTGGVVSVITPNRAALYARLMGARWVEYQKPDEHVAFFSSGLVRRLLSEIGFELDWCGTAGKHVSVDFALSRLASYGKFPFEIIRSALRHMGIGGTVVYVNPGDKMHIIGRKTGLDERRAAC